MKPPGPISQGPPSRGPDSQRLGGATISAQRPAPDAFWFGAPERPLFGWYHAPAKPARAVVVLCNPIGHESLILHRTYRCLAQHLASLGFATLRFDYDGTGDSAGTDEDPARVEAWVDSVQQAVQEAATRSRCRDVILVGTRIGALLATAAAKRSSVAALVLIAPPRAGKAWLREMRAMQAIKDSRLGPVESTTSERGIAGFLLDEATRADLSELSFRGLTTPPAPHAFVVARDDLSGGEPELVRSLAELGVKAELCLAPGYAASMPEDPFKSVVPMQVFEALSNWLDPLFPAPPMPTLALPALPSEPADVAPASRRRPDSIALLSSWVQERVASINGLFGILTEPTAVPTKAAVVLLNIGANHHIGSNRMYVQMARTWAARGIRTLRMDFSGMGDSQLTNVGKENEVYAGRFMTEARQAVDFLIEEGETRIFLLGLCSGAYVAYHTATADPRVAGVVLINPLTFHWTEGDSLEVRIRTSFASTTQYKRKLFQFATWRRLLHGEVKAAAVSAELARRVRRRLTFQVRSAVARLTGEIAETTDIERGFRRLSARGSTSFLILGAEDGSRDAVAEYLGKDAAAMASVRGFRIEIWREPDHTFTPLGAQRKLIDTVGEHLLNQQNSD